MPSSQSEGGPCHWMSSGSDPDQVVWQSSQSGCDALNKLMSEAAQPVCNSPLSVHAIQRPWSPVHGTSIAQSTPSSSKTLHNPSSSRGLRTRPSRTNVPPTSTFTTTSAAASATSPTNLPSASLPVEGKGDPTLLISLIKDVSRQVDENSNLQRRVFAKERARAKEKEREQRRKEAKSRLRVLERTRKEASAKGKEKTGSYMKEEVNFMDGDAMRSLLRSGPSPGSKLRIVDNGNMVADGGMMDVDVDSAPTFPSTPIAHDKGKMLPPPPPFSLYKSQAANLTRPVPKMVQSTSEDKRNAPLARPNHTSLAAVRDPDLSTTMPLSPESPNDQSLVQKRPLYDIPAARVSTKFMRDEKGGAHPTRHTFAGPHTPQSVDLPPASPGPSQAASQAPASKLKPKLPALGMRRGASAPLDTAPSMRHSVSGTPLLSQSLGLPSRQRSFQTPFAKPSQSDATTTPSAVPKFRALASMSTSALCKSLPTPDATPPAHSNFPRPPAAVTPPSVADNRKNGLRATVSHVDTPNKGRSSSPAPETADTSFGSIDFDLGIDPEELERACSVYD